MSAARICKAFSLILAVLSCGVILAGVFWAWLDPSLALALLDGGPFCR